MNHFDSRLSGSKRRYGFSDEDQPEDYAMPFSRPMHTSHSSEDSQSPPNSQDSRLPKVFERQSIQTQPQFDNTLAYIPASLQASLAYPLPPLSSTMRSATYTLPPLSLSSRTTTSTTPPFDKLSSESTTDDRFFQDLQRDDISAYAPGKIQVADLDKAVRTSSLDFEKLVKERQVLKAKVDVLEAEIEELQNTIEQSKRHSVAKDTQYSQIVEMSSRLQIQATAGAKHQRLQMDEWSIEKGTMQQTITSLRSEVRMLRRAYNGFSPPTQDSFVTSADEMFDGELDDAQSSPIRLAAEVRSLRHANAALKDALEHVREEHTQLMEQIEKLGDVGKKMQTHLMRGNAHDVETEIPNGGDQMLEPNR